MVPPTTNSFRRLWFLRQVNNCKKCIRKCGDDVDYSIVQPAAMDGDCARQECERESEREITAHTNTATPTHDRFDSILSGAACTSSISHAAHKTCLVLRRSPSPNDIAGHLPSAKSAPQLVRALGLRRFNLIKSRVNLSASVSVTQQMHLVLRENIRAGDKLVSS